MVRSQDVGLLLCLSPVDSNVIEPRGTMRLIEMDGEVDAHQWPHSEMLQPMNTYKEVVGLLAERDT